MNLRQRLEDQPGLRFCIPLALFLLLTQAQSGLSGPPLFWFYGAKSLLVGLALVFLFRGRAAEIPGRIGIDAVICGAAALLVWIVVGKLSTGDHAVSFDPAVLAPGIERGAGIALRIFGAVLVVPAAEEIFWRGFLMRYLIDENFLKVDIGAYSRKSFFGTLVCFVLVHRPFEWAGAALVGAIYGLFVIKQKNLRGVIAAHALTNLGLAVYVIVTGEYWWW